MDNSVRCGNCRFFKAGDTYSWCRKNAPPEIKLEPASLVITEDYWCGEFKRKLIHEEDNRNLEPQKLVVRQCGNCIHFEIQGGNCTYNPPIKIITDDGSGTFFPRPSKTFCCSKFRAREIIIEGPQNTLTTGKRAITLGDS